MRYQQSPSASYLPGSIAEPDARLARRELLRIGAVSVLSAGSSVAHASGSATRRADGVIFMLLQGGPSHLDLWDLKPQAPDQIRGPFQPIATTVPGMQVGEMLPRTAAVAQHLALLRSVEHRFTNHIAGTYITLTGSTDQPDADREAAAGDFPGPGAVLQYLQRSPSPVPQAISLPTWLSIPGPSNRMPGQYGGFLGSLHDPFVVAGEPHKADFKPLTLTLPDDCPGTRLSARWSLREQLDAAAWKLEGELARTHDHLAASAYELLADARLRQALDLSQEPDAMRDRYGRTKIGQSLLLARRLIEAGVKLVSYNAFNQEWDTHGGLEGRYKKIVPPLDQAYSALIEDLAARGLLPRTLVVHCGEFGRTPIINADAGRDHWPHAYSVVLAGGGLRGGFVHGASDARGAYVARDGVSPADLLATMWHVLGIDPATEVRDRVNRPIGLSRGRALHELLV